MLSFIVTAQFSFYFDKTYWTIAVPIDELCFILIKV